MSAHETLRLRGENKQLRDQLDQMRRERDRALIAGSLHVCTLDEQMVGAVAGSGEPDGGA